MCYWILWEAESKVMKPKRIRGGKGVFAKRDTRIYRQEVRFG